MLSCMLRLYKSHGQIFNSKFLTPNLAGDSPDKAVTYGGCNKLDLEK